MSDIFALRDSSLNAFLLSDVGVEANGTRLTILSLLARLGKDPWIEAAAWADKPRDTAIMLLTNSISQMPPNQQALDDARQTASRLIGLLPSRDTVRVRASVQPALAAIPRSTVLTLVLAALFIAFSVWLAVAPNSAATGTTAVGRATTSAK
jgi:hypothetical protein